MPWKKLSLYWRDGLNTNCEICSTDEGKFIVVVDIGKTENDRNFEREEYYCLSCFQDLIKP